jgi:hypothetical protein
VSPLAPPGPSLAGKEGFAFLQCPTEVGELLGSRVGGMFLGEEIPLGSISMDMTNIMFHDVTPTFYKNKILST